MYGKNNCKEFETEALFKQIENDNDLKLFTGLDCLDDKLILSLDAKL